MLQAVLSYCTQTGDRRTRVHTLTLGCSRHLRDIFRQYQAQTLLTFYCKKSKFLSDLLCLLVSFVHKVEQLGPHTELTSSCACPVYCAVLERPLQELRGELQTDVTEALASYRKHSCSVSVSAGQVMSGNINYTSPLIIPLKSLIIRL